MQPAKKEPYDMSEEGSRLPDEEATQALRQQESDDNFEGTVHGPVDVPYRDQLGENRVSTSLDDE
jgi:hypothetical protein